LENKKIIYYKQLDSTNTEIARLAAEGAAHGTVVMADAQTAGKGRRGRQWESPAGENIYMSILLRPNCLPDRAPMLTLVMAYSVAKVLTGLGFPDVQIKWPNDLVLSGKKICGILTEMQLNGSEIDYVVVGVGINVNTSKFPEELKDTATSLYMESGRVSDRETLVESIVESFDKAYRQFLETQDLSFLKEEYNDMLVNVAREVRVLEPGNEYIAYAQGINSEGELLVRTADGEEKCIYAGEVSVRGIYGYIT
jgi:BirA family biotin operon repressor/biotin-[acetyl-CoA-carboxylase] ligase